MQAPLTPYAEKRRRIKQASRRINAQEGVVIPVEKNAWLTPGVVTTIEKGRPLVSESKLSKPFVDPERIREELESEKQKTLDKYYSFFDIGPKSPRFEVEIPGTPNMKNKNLIKIKKRPKTGIAMRTPAPDIIDSIGALTLKSVDPDQTKEMGINPLAPIARKISKPRIPSRLDSTRLVKQQLKRVFQPGVTPFKHVDSEDSFPMNLFQRVEVEIKRNEEVEEAHPTIDSMLIDPSEYDITWDKSGAPFTKSELRMLSKWRQRGVEEVKRRDEQIHKVEEEHEHYVKRTFQSRLAFEKHLQTTNQLVDRIVNVGPGKGEKHRDFLWKESSKEAMSDPASLPYRQRVWKRFAHAISKDEGLTTEAQHNLVKRLQEQLIAGDEAVSTMFWRTLDAYKWDDFLSVSNMCVLEHLREVFGISKEDLVQYFKKNGYPHEFYRLAQMAIEERRRKAQKIIDDSKKISTFSEVKIKFS